MEISEAHATLAEQISHIPWAQDTCQHKALLGQINHAKLLSQKYPPSQVKPTGQTFQISL